uniref:Uncharacterized protein n=1 Tax=Glossina brevipalpis TaxID=37001 RepID=A0A1A9W497_9MUSC
MPKLTCKRLTETSPPFTAVPLFICFDAGAPVERRVSHSDHSQLHFSQLSEKYLFNFHFKNKI